MRASRVGELFRELHVVLDQEARHQNSISQRCKTPDVTEAAEHRLTGNPYQRLRNFYLIHQIAKLNEWTWTNPANGVPFLYSDGTTLAMNPVQRVSFIGASYVYKLQ